MAKSRRKNGDSITNLLAIALLALVAIGVYSVHKAQDDTVPHPAPDSVLQEPTIYREAVEPIRIATIADDDGKALAGFYMSLARVVENDSQGESIKDLETLRRVNANSGKLCFQNTPTYMSYGHISPVVDRAIAQGAGTSIQSDGTWVNVEITPNNRRSIVDAIRAVAWASYR